MPRLLFLFRRRQQIPNFKSLGQITAEPELAAQVELIDGHEAARHGEQVIEAAMHVGFRVVGRCRLDLHAVFVKTDRERACAAPDDGDLHDAMIAALVFDAIGALIFHIAVAQLVKGFFKGDRFARARAAAKKARNYAEADRIRDMLAAEGITIIDTPQGAKWKRA